MNTPNQDPLQRCLLALARHHGEATSAEALISGLPLEHGRLTPSLFARAAARANLTANVVNRWPAQVSEDLLPAVILSEAEQACVLMGWSADVEVAQVIYPDLPDAEVAVAARIFDNPDLRVLVEGHSDDTGTRIRNRELANQRAVSVKRRLVQQTR